MTAPPPRPPVRAVPDPARLVRAMNAAAGELLGLSRPGAARLVAAMTDLLYRSCDTHHDNEETWHRQLYNAARDYAAGVRN